MRVTESMRNYVHNTYSGQYSLLTFHGKLTDGWENVANHCIIQTIAIEELSGMIGLPNHDQKLLAQVALCHDWKKRLEKCPDDFTQKEKDAAKVRFAQVMGIEQAKMDAVADNPLSRVFFDRMSDEMELLLKATNPSFLLRATKSSPTLLELIQFLVDDMTKGDEIVSFRERIAEVSARNPHPDENVEKQLGRPYWDVELEVCETAESIVYRILDARHYPNNLTLPQLINNSINARFPK